MKGRRKRELNASEIVYGLIVIGLIIYMLIDTAISGRGGNDADLW